MASPDLTLRIKRLRSRLDALRPRRGAGINRHEHRVYSQHREDGILRHLLTAAGIDFGTCIEFGFGPTQANCLELALHHDHRCLFMDGNEEKCRQLSAVIGGRGLSSRVLNAFLTRENIDGLVAEQGFAGEISVLSIDVDGNDYWLWEAIECCDPAVVVIEYNASFGPERAVTVPYDPQFIRYQKHPSGLYHGASLAGLCQLAERRDYRLVGVDSSGVNAFFLANRFEAPGLATLAPTEAYRPHRGRTKHKGLSVDAQWAAVADMPYVEV